MKNLSLFEIRIGSRSFLLHTNIDISCVYGICIYTMQNLLLSLSNQQSLCYIELNWAHRYLWPRFLSLINYSIVLKNCIPYVNDIEFALNQACSISWHGNKKFSTCGSDRNTIILDLFLQLHKKEKANWNQICSFVSVMTT